MAGEPEKSRRDQAGRFAAGVSGNPAGRPRGCRDRATRAAEALLDGEAERLTRRAIDLALDGDIQALRICLDRILPVQRRRPASLDLPLAVTATDIASAIGAVITGAASGEIDVSDAASVVTMFDAQRRAIETAELERRISALEHEAARE